MPDFVKFCKQQNIAFTDSERLLFDINLTKRGHRLYTKCIERAYKQSAGPYKDRLDTYLMDDSEIARMQLDRAEEIYQRALNKLDAAETGMEGAAEIEEAKGKIEDLQRITRDL